MIVYGINFKKKKSFFLKNKHYNLNKKIKKSSQTKPNCINLNYRVFVFNYPSSWNFIILQNTKLNQYVFYFYSQYYYFMLNPLKTLNTCVVDMNTCSVQFQTLYPNTFYKTYWTTLLLIFSALNHPFFKKIKFKGKGYYIYKNKRQTITPQFGHSHRLYLYSYYTSVIFLSKTQIFIFGLSKIDVISVALGIKKMRPINIFTGRGVRFSRQIVYRKVGKVSSYR